MKKRPLGFITGGIFVVVKMTALQMGKNIGNESGVQSGVSYGHKMLP